MFNTIKRLSSFTQSNKGSVFVLVAVGAITLMTATGAAVDMARAQILKTRLTAAMDAAALAAANTALTVNVQTQAQKYFNANFPTGYMGSGPVIIHATLSSDNSTVNLTASTTMSTVFMQLVGISNVGINGSSQVVRQSSGMELVLVLDNTGSMNCDVTNPNETYPCPLTATSKITALQTAVSNLLNILYGSNDTLSDLWVGVVPFSQAVNIGTSNSNWLSANTNNWGPTTWGGCVMARTSPYDISDDTPSTQLFPQYYYPCTTTSQLNEWYGTDAAHTNCTSSTSSTSSTSTSSTSSSHSSSSSTSTSSTSSSHSSSTSSTSTSSTSSSHSSSTSTSSTSTSSTSSTSTSTSGGHIGMLKPLGHASEYAEKENMQPWYMRLLGIAEAYAASSFGYFSPLNTTQQGPNLYCPQPMLPMVASKTTVLNTVNALVAGGDTTIDLGLAWGWRMLSPRWNGLWVSSNPNITYHQPVSYNTPLIQKVVILMTDGMNHMYPGNYTAYDTLAKGQLGSTVEATAEATLNTRTLSVCNSLKANGVIVYTIGFGSNGNNDPNDPTSVNGPLLQSCASTPSATHYFLAPTNAALQAVFQQIGDSLANLHISQ